MVAATPSGHPPTRRYVLRLHAALGREHKVRHERNVDVTLLLQRALQCRHCRLGIGEVDLHVILEGLDEVGVLGGLDHLEIVKGWWGAFR